MSRPLTRLNPSLIAIGAVVVLLVLFFLPQTGLWVLSFLPQTHLWGLSLSTWILISLVVVSVLATSFVPVADLANFATGALAFLLAYQSQRVRELLFSSGAAIFAFLFLVIIAIFIKRPRYVD